MYEYGIIIDRFDNIINNLNDKAKDGWEAVNMDIDHDTSGTKVFVLVKKKYATTKDKRSA